MGILTLETLPENQLKKLTARSEVRVGVCHHLSIWLQVQDTHWEVEVGGKKTCNWQWTQIYTFPIQRAWSSPLHSSCLSLIQEKQCRRYTIWKQQWYSLLLLLLIITMLEMIVTVICCGEPQDARELCEAITCPWSWNYEPDKSTFAWRIHGSLPLRVPSRGSLGAMLRGTAVISLLSFTRSDTRWNHHTSV